MKRSIAHLVVVALVICAPAARAQQWGMSVAHTWSVQWETLRPWHAGGSVPVYRMRADLAGGVSYRRQFRPWLAVQPELWLTTKGTGYRPESYVGTTLRYIEAPITARFFGVMPGRHGVRPVTSVGAWSSVLLSCAWRYRHERLACSDTSSSPAHRGEDRRHPRTDYGFHIGFGAERRTRSGSMSGLDLRVSVGLRDLEGRRGGLYRQNFQTALIASYAR